MAMSPSINSGFIAVPENDICRDEHKRREMDNTDKATPQGIFCNLPRESGHMWENLGLCGKTPYESQVLGIGFQHRHRLYQCLVCSSIGVDCRDADCTTLCISSAVGCIPPIEDEDDQKYRMYCLKRAIINGLNRTPATCFDGMPVAVFPPRHPDDMVPNEYRAWLNF